MFLTNQKHYPDLLNICFNGYLKARLLLYTIMPCSYSSTASGDSPTRCLFEHMAFIGKEERDLVCPRRPLSRAAFVPTNFSAFFASR